MCNAINAFKFIKVENVWKIKFDIYCITSRISNCLIYILDLKFLDFNKITLPQNMLLIN